MVVHVEIATWLISYVVQMRNLKKKLQQIDALQARQHDGQLDEQQHAKVAQRAELVATLDALQSGCSLADAQRLAQPAKRLSSATSSDLLHRSSSTTSLDSSAGKRRPRTGKHKQPSSQLSRLSMTASDQDSAQLDTAGPDLPLSPTHLQQAQPASQSATPANAEQDLSSTTLLDQASSSAAAVEAVSPMPSAWQRPDTTSTGFTISGFSTPQPQKTAATAWPSPRGGSLGMFDQAGPVHTASPSSGGPASRAKPPRKGGLSMFLSGLLTLS